MSLHLAIDIGNLVAMLGLLWKASQLFQRVDMMWKVFAADHGLDGSRTNHPAA